MTDWENFDFQDHEAFSICGLADLKEMPEVLGCIRLDVTPSMMMEPRFSRNPEDQEKLKQICGYMFYVETAGEKPELMLLKIGSTDITSTFARIDEISAEMLQRAIDSPVQKPESGMYAITEEIKQWLRKELGI